MGIASGCLGGMTEVGWVVFLHNLCAFQKNANGEIMWTEIDGKQEFVYDPAWGNAWDLAKRLVDAKILTCADTVTHRMCTTAGATIDRAPVITDPKVAAMLLRSLEQHERRNANAAGTGQPEAPGLGP